MDWTWGMSEGESCHARLQVSGLSTWVDGGAFSPKPRDDWGRSRDWGENIKISLQKPQVLQEGVKLCRAEVVGEGLCVSWKHNSSQELPPPLNPLNHLAGGTMVPFFRGGKLRPGDHPCSKRACPQCRVLCQGLRLWHLLRHCIFSQKTLGWLGATHCTKQKTEAERPDCISKRQRTTPGLYSLPQKPIQDPDCGCAEPPRSCPPILFSLTVWGLSWGSK